MISFKAQKIDNVSVMQMIEGGNSYGPKKTSFVELKPYSEADKETLEGLSKNWSFWGDAFVDTILQDFDNYYTDRVYDKQFFALTTQNCNHTRLNPYEVLGIVQARKMSKNKCYIDYIQTAPDTAYGAPVRAYKKVGKAMLDVLKKYYKGVEIRLYSVASAIDFYKKNGFKMVGDSKYMVFKPRV